MSMFIFRRTLISFRRPQPQALRGQQQLEASLEKVVKTKTVTVRQALNEAMDEEMAINKNVVLMGEEVGLYDGAYKISKGLLAKYGEHRVVDLPITEQGFTGMAIGAAMGGLNPICEFMTWNFSLQAIDQIVNSAAKTPYMTDGKQAVPIVFRGPNGAAAGVAAQHSQDLTSWYASVPGLKVISPYNAWDAKGLLKAAIRDGNPIIFLENEIMYGKSFEVDEKEFSSSASFVLPIGKAFIERQGSDLSLISHSKGVGDCLEAAKILQEEDGIDVEVINLRSIRPLDVDTIVQSIRKTNRCVTVESGWPAFGIGAEIGSVINEHCFDDLDLAPLRITGADCPMPYAKGLEELSTPNVDAIVKKIRHFLS